MRDKYYTRKSDGKNFSLCGSISNGKLLTKFDEKTGISFGNYEYKVFVTEEQLKTEFTKFEFKLETSEALDGIILKYMSDFMYQFRNYGIAENQAEAFDGFYQAASFRHNVYKDMIKDPKAEWKDFLSNDDDEWEFADCEDLFNMLTGGMIPIIKKMLIEAQEEGKK